MKPNIKRLETMHEDELLDQKELAEILGISQKTIALWRSEGKPPQFRRYGRKFVRYLVSDIRNFINNK